MSPILYVIFFSVMSCEPSWYVSGLPCPNGEALPLEVTSPNDPNFWQTSCVIYGYVPWGVSFAIALLFIIYRGTREIALGITIGVAVGISQIIKAVVEEPRPATSCLHTCGMPSSHSAVSMALFTFLILDAGYRLLPPNGESGFIPGWKTMTQTTWKMIKGLSFLTFSPVSQFEFYTYFAIWAFAFMPVPISRAIVGDHSPTQILAGGIVGWGSAMIWFPICVQIRKSLRDHVGKKFLWIFVHNYDMPEGWKPLPKTTPSDVNEASDVIRRPDSTLV
jgi:membrane-associated phospholipid phosphatase